MSISELDRKRLTRYLQDYIDGVPQPVAFSTASIAAGLDNGTTDAFARQRFSQPFTIFDSKMLVDNLPLFYDDQEVSGNDTGSTYSAARASVQMTVDPETAGKRVRQTYRRFNYQPGKSQLIVLTGIFTGGARAGITREIGLFDDDNGLFFRLADSTLSVNVRSSASGSAVTTTVPQANWNIDKLDGTGASGAVIDVSKAHIWFIDFEWLGVGRVRFGVYVDGAPIYVHAFNNFNALDAVYMSTPNLPIRYSIENDGTGAAATLEQICSTVISEGAQEPTGVIRAQSRDSTFVTTDTANWFPLISFRLKSNALGTAIDFLSFSALCVSTAVYEVALLWNPAVAGVDAASWQDVPNSALQYDVSRTTTNVLTPSVIIDMFVAEDTRQVGGVINARLNNALRLGAAIDGTRDEIVLAVRRLTGTTETFYANATWREQN